MTILLVNNNYITTGNLIKFKILGENEHVNVGKIGITVKPNIVITEINYNSFSEWKKYKNNRGVIQVDSFIFNKVVYTHKEKMLLNIPVLFDENYDIALLTNFIKKSKEKIPVPIKFPTQWLVQNKITIENNITILKETL